MSIMLATCREINGDELAKVTAWSVRESSMIVKILDKAQKIENLTYLDIGKAYGNEGEWIEALNRLAKMDLTVLDISKSSDVPATFITKLRERKPDLDIIMTEKQEIQALEDKPIVDVNEKYRLEIADARTPLQSLIILQEAQSGKRDFSPQLCREILQGSAHHGVVGRLLDEMEKQLQNSPDTAEQYRDVLRNVCEGRKVSATNMDKLIGCFDKYLEPKEFNQENYDFYVELLENSNQTIMSQQTTKNILQKMNELMSPEDKKEREEKLREQEQKIEQRLQAAAKRAEKRMEITQTINMLHLDRYIKSEASVNEKGEKLKEALAIVRAYPNEDNLVSLHRISDTILVEDSTLTPLTKQLISESCNNLLGSEGKLYDYGVRTLTDIADLGVFSDEELQPLSRQLCESLNTALAMGKDVRDLYKILDRLWLNSNIDGIVLQNSYEDLEKVYLAQPEQAEKIFAIYSQSLHHHKIDSICEKWSDHLSTLASIVGDAVPQHPELVQDALNILLQIENLAILNTNGFDKEYILGKVKDGFAKIEVLNPQAAQMVSNVTQEQRILTELVCSKDMEVTVRDKLLPQLDSNPDLVWNICDRLCNMGYKPYVTPEQTGEEKSLQWNVHVLQQSHATPPHVSTSIQLLTEYLIPEIDKDANKRELLSEYTFLLSECNQNHIPIIHHRKVLQHLVELGDDKAIRAFVCGLNHLKGDRKTKFQDMCDTGIIKNDPDMLLEYMNSILRGRFNDVSEYLSCQKFLKDCEPIQNINRVLDWMKLFETRLQDSSSVKTLDDKKLHRAYVESAAEMIHIVNKMPSIPPTASTVKLRHYLHVECGRDPQDLVGLEECWEDYLLPLHSMVRSRSPVRVDAYALGNTTDRQNWFHDDFFYHTKQLYLLRQNTKSSGDVLLQDYPEICNHLDCMAALHKNQGKPDGMQLISPGILKSATHRLRLYEKFSKGFGSIVREKTEAAQELFYTYLECKELGVDGKDIYKAIYDFRFGNLGYSERQDSEESTPKEIINTLCCAARNEGKTIPPEIEDLTGNVLFKNRLEKYFER